MFIIDLIIKINNSMIKEMKLNRALSPTNKENLTKSVTLSPKNPKSPLREIIESDSTFYNTLRERNEKQIKDDKVLDCLKNFVQSSSKKSSKNQSTTSVVFTSKDYMKNNNQLYHNFFTNSKKNSRSSSSVSKLYSSFNKEEHSCNNGNLYLT